MAGMRLGKDMVVFSKQEQAWSCLVLSQTGLHGESLVPRGGVHVASAALLTWNATPKDFAYSGTAGSYTPLLDFTKTYTPFSTLDALLEQFGRITGGCCAPSTHVVPDTDTEMTLT